MKAAAVVKFVSSIEAPLLWMHDGCEGQRASPSLRSKSATWAAPAVGGARIMAFYAKLTVTAATIKNEEKDVIASEEARVELDSTPTKE